MTISRVSDAQSFSLLVDRAGQLQVSLQTLEQEVSSGKRLFTPDDDPIGAATATRAQSSLAALAQYDSSSNFGTDVLGAEDKALGEGEQILVRAEEIATQQASSLLSPGERAAAREEVHGLLEGLTALGNTELGGRRIFGGLALDGAAPFASVPEDVSAYDPAKAYTGSAQEFSVKVGGTSSERVRITTRGDTVFQRSLQALKDLWTALDTNGDTAGTLAGLGSARDDLSTERASVGARQAELVSRTSQVKSLTVDQQKVLSDAQDADLVAVIARLTQTQTALQATLTAGAEIARTSLVDLLRL
ncbi:MAG: hypothetical protein E6J79_08015 [Deltaproteobacteria bacterium]|nr:MAG: hypothetical protein E6J79_08015 [Deltaproteobacteria bacterium]